MKTAYNLLKRGYIEFITCITLNGYRIAVISDSKIRESNLLLQYTVKNYQSVVKQVEERQDLIASNNTEVVASLGRIKQNLELIDRVTHNLINQISINNNKGIDTSSKVLIKSTSNNINEINKLVDKVNGSNNNYLRNIFEFSSYTTAELGAISHIFACIFIFCCLFDIDDYLIIYYKLKKIFSIS